ncbi:sialidase family protein [Marinicella litoralis]|uniref:Fibronectin type-III domain-containing protein n=1 Tax=Marinicella litoralis TaxID=644220 RepID=A0A4R6XUH9_9GAMM|nr:sialidase family protein [Marinicella litoralis]TDR23652.1 hypothetical protein C8D91_0516 [Marinicella litoralis]
MKKIIIITTMLLVFFTAEAEIRQALGVDQRVDYPGLVKFGPWDDRNYAITKSDFDLIPNKDQYLANVPAFFKITMRKEMPHLGEFYPRSTYQLFQIRHGGLLQDGKWMKSARGAAWHKGDDPNGKGVPPVVKLGGPDLIPDVEFTLDSALSGNEVSVEFNPTNPLIGVAGSNRSGGQTMYYTQDGGLTWTRSQVNPSSCCDPTIDWSSDGSKVYQADLSSAIGVRWAVSNDQGQTWGPMQVLTPNGSDKEFIHVDRSLTSPYTDNVYLTYHNGNVMQFARSIDMGVSFETPMAFSGEPTGIGSDITTDAAGIIYYVYPSLASATGIRLLKSTDGGVTFATGTMIAALNGRFDFPIPAMEDREVFIYVSADVDMSGGPNDGRIYVSWTDETDDSAGGGNGSAANNHGWIEVYYSDDQGSNWTRMPHPHETSDGLTVDRFHPWLKVAENGVVHIGYYDTRHSTNRTGVDFYYNSSVDGETWLGEQRFSTVTSTNLPDGQEWGDYNGLSVVLDRLAMTWTDNRPGNGKAAIAGSVTNPTGAPSYGLSLENPDILLCDGMTDVTANLNISSLLGFNNNVTLSVSSSPSISSNESFSVNPVTPPGTSVFEFDVSGGSSGDYILAIQGTASDGNGGNIVRSVDLNIGYNTTAPAMPTQISPANGATLVASDSVTFDWSALPEAREYVIEIATDVAFNNIVYSETVDSNTTTVLATLNSSTEYFWSVRGQNACAGGPNSVIFNFTTAPLPGDCPANLVTKSVVSFDFENGAEGWTSGVNSGADTWTLSNANPAPGGSVQHWHVDDQGSVSDTYLTSPVISLPAGQSPLSFHFMNYQEMEDDGNSQCWDGGILEVSENAGPFVQVDNSLLGTDPYDGPFRTGTLQGSLAWCGDPQSYLNSIVDIDSFAGNDVQFRFRVLTDTSVSHPGWDIDNIKINGCYTDLIFEHGFEQP